MEGQGDSPALSQVDWSGGNSPENGATVETNQPAVFRYQIYDAGRTEAPGGGMGLGAVRFYRDAAIQDAFASVPMEYSTQGGIGGHDDVFTVTVPFAAFGGAASVEYFSVAYDSLVQPVHADTTQQDAHGPRTRCPTCGKVISGCLPASCRPWPTTTWPTASASGTRAWCPSTGSW